MILDAAIEALARARAPKEPPAPVGAEVVADSVFERPHCPSCGNTRGEVVLVAGDDWVDADYSGQRFAVVRCQICAHRYTSPRFKRSHKHLAFQGEYPFYSRARAARRGVSADLEAARAPFHGRGERLFAAHPAPGRLLDVGAGDGFFGDVMRARGWEVVAVDNEADVVWHARERLGLEAYALDVEEDPLPPGPFDAVTLWGVLQLVYEPRALLEKVRQVLSPEGVLAIGVSNVRSAGASLFGARWRGLGLPRHLSHFTPETLTRLVSWCGFEVLGLAYETPRWIMSGSVDAAVPRPVRRAAKAILYPAGHLLGKTSRADTLELYARPGALRS